MDSVEYAGSYLAPSSSIDSASAGRSGCGKDWYEAETEFPPDAADPANPKATVDLLQPRLRIQRPLHPTDRFRSVRGLNVAAPATMGLSLVESSRSQGGKSRIPARGERLLAVNDRIVSLGALAAIAQRTLTRALDTCAAHPMWRRRALNA